MSARIDEAPAATGRNWPTAVVLVVAFGVVAGPLGVLAGTATALIGYLLGTPYALAAGHVALVVSVPDAIDPLSFVIVESAFVVVLLAPVRRTARPARTALVTITSALALAGATWLLVDSHSVHVAAVTLLALLVLAAYGLHRLELVRLGLISDGDSTPPTTELTDDSTIEHPTEPSAETTTEP